ncbi:hypothetical protein ACO1PK_01355 [Alishewanella sp. d11]|uniref:hypothetical protein n=1 Tax=Alishewanella sp. d11 TaxID=3414030 RepID=UPI003BF89EDC
MALIHTSLLYLHIFFGALCLLLFWLPVISQKGSKLHNFSGRIYYYFMLFIAGSGMVMSAMVLFDPIAVYTSGNPLPAAKVDAFVAARRQFSSFLFLLSILTWVTIRHAYEVLAAKDQRQLLQRWQLQLPVAVLFCFSFYVFWLGWQSKSPLFMIFSSVSFFSAIGIWRYIWQRQIKKRQWIIEHFGNMIGSGIALYTAFFAAGGRKILADILTGHWQIASWVIAPLLGVLAIQLFKKHFQRKFNVTA